MTNPNEALLDASIKHLIDQKRYFRGVVNDMIGKLQKQDEVLAAEIALIVAEIPADAPNKREIDKQVNEALREAEESNEEIMALLLMAMQSLAEIEARWWALTLERVAPSEDVEAIDPVAVYDAERNKPILGRTVAQWLAGAWVAKKDRIKVEINKAYYTTGDTSKLVQELRGTKKNGYMDGILGRTANDLRAITETVLADIAAKAREDFVAANAHLFDAEQWVSVLDSRTTLEYCVPRNGLLYKVKTHEPLSAEAQRFPWGGGPGRIHPRCRSSSVPVLKGYEPPQKVSYWDWLQRQSDQVQRHVLGKMRYDLWKNKGVKPEQFYDDAGEFLTLKQFDELSK